MNYLDWKFKKNVLAVVHSFYSKHKLCDQISISIGPKSDGPSFEYFVQCHSEGSGRSSSDRAGKDQRNSPELHGRSQ
jgi:hypothetical protein